MQGTAADIIKVTMKKEKVERIVLEEMQNAFHMAVPLVADSGFGDNWLEAH
jgi:DNA polymerase-1